MRTFIITHNQWSIIQGYSWLCTISIIAIKLINCSGMRGLHCFSYQHNCTPCYWLDVWMRQGSRHNYTYKFSDNTTVVSTFDNHVQVWRRTPQFGTSVNPANLFHCQLPGKYLCSEVAWLLDDSAISLLQQLLSELVLRLPPKYTAWQMTEGKSLLLQEQEKHLGDNFWNSAYFSVSDWLYQSLFLCYHFTAQQTGVLSGSIMSGGKVENMNSV